MKTKKRIKTKDRILEKALELMNLHGMENVSTYDISRALNIRQSNITYYFPTKAHIVNALGKNMIEDVDAVVALRFNKNFSLMAFYWTYDEIMQVHQKYHFFFMNFATIIIADEELNTHFKAVLEKRPELVRAALTVFEDGGYLLPGQMSQNHYAITLMLNIVGIFWLQEAAIYSSHLSDKEKRQHYLNLYFQIFIPYLTDKGKENLLPLLEETVIK